MCYSAQVVQIVRKPCRELGVRLDYAEAEKLFLRRLDDPTVNISRGFEANFDEPVDETGRRIKRAIDEHRSRAAIGIEKDLFAQKTRLTNAHRALQAKETKKAREEIRIAGAAASDCLGTRRLGVSPRGAESCVTVNGPMQRTYG